MGMVERTDFLVLGNGVAGLSFALRAAKLGTVTVLAKSRRTEANTAWAQGGIAGVLSPEDTFESHIRDTLEAGAGLCNPAAVELVVRRGPEAIQQLTAFGAEFDRRIIDGTLDLGREGGHSKRRIVHAGDITGREVERSLLAACDADDKIRILEDHTAIDLITEKSARLGESGRCLGAYVLHDGRIDTHLAKVTVLATGGAGKVYLYTSNPDVATGDGVAMAYRAGAEIANMEFYQFHPTCLFHPQAKSFLISEALRGEGGVLKLKTGEAFMARYDPRKDLATRDVVARAIDRELKRTGDDCVYLDMTHLGRSFLLQRFPNIYSTCKEFGVDMAAQPIPVVPAAHFQCGGVKTDLAAQTALPNLLAIGEVACTGLHGANRLASNSLLEGLVMGAVAAETAVKLLADHVAPKDTPPPWDAGRAVEPDEAVVVSQNWDEIRRLMWNYVGIVRTDKRLMRAKRRLELLREEIRDYYWNFKVSRDVVELRNLADVAWLIVECATRRKESRGLHYTLDYPNLDENRGKLDTVVRR
jgi:L-aspartate oxidase